MELKMNITTSTESIKKGIELALSLIESTYGPWGANVCAVGTGHTVGAYFDDGVQALRQFVPEDAMVRQGVKLILDAAEAQHRAVGDGTSTTAILTAHLILQGLKLRDTPNADNAGREHIVAAQKIEQACEFVIERLEALGKRCSENIDPRQAAVALATIAMHGDQKLGEMVGGLVAELGPTGIVTAEPATDQKWKVRRANGYAWAGAPFHEAFLGGKGVFVGDRPLVIVAAGQNASVKEEFWKGCLNSWKSRCDADGRQIPLLIVAPEVSGSLLSTLIADATAAVNNGLPVRIVAVRSPMERPMLEDLAYYCGCKVVDDLAGSLRMTFSPEYFGQLESVRVSRNAVSLTNSKRDVDSRVAEINAILEEAEVVTTEMVEAAGKRIAALKSSSAVIEVPVIAQVQFNEDAEKIEDGYRAAIGVFDGVLPGGGIALALTGHDYAGLGGEELIANAFFQPKALIFPDFAAGYDDKFELNEQNVFNPREQDSPFSDFLTAGVVDSVKSLTNAVRNAGAVAAPVIRAKYYIVQQGV